LGDLEGRQTVDIYHQMTEGSQAGTDAFEAGELAMYET
jgi:hypothetical protein